MKKLSSLLSAAILLTSFTSCLNDDNDQEYTLTLGYSCYNHVYSIADATTALKAAGYTIGLDLSKSTVELQIYGSYATNQEAVTLTLNDIPLTTTSTGYTFSSSTIQPTTVSSGSVSSYNITNLSGRICSYYRYDTSSGSTVTTTTVEVSYTLNDNYEVFACWTQPFFVNCSTTTTGGSEPYTTTTTTYSAAFNDTSTATITINNAQFASNMPQLTMTLEEIPITLTRTGYQLNADQVIPEINGVPYESYAISNLQATVNSYSTALSLTFDCTVSGVTYTVTATGSIYPAS